MTDDPKQTETDPDLDLRIKPDKRTVLSCLFLVLPFFGGIIACIVLLSLGFAVGWGLLAVGSGILPVLSYGIYVKAREKHAIETIKKIDVSKYERRAGRVLSCEVSSYKPGYSADPRPYMYRIKADVGGVKYTVYGTERYGVGEPCFIYVRPDGGFAQIAGRGDGASALKSETTVSKQMTAEEDAFLDDLSEKCDDYTYDMLYDAWERECEGFDKDQTLTRSETQAARYETSVKYRKLIAECYDEYNGDKTDDGFISITRERMWEYLRRYESEKRNIVAAPPKSDTPPESAAKTDAKRHEAQGDIEYGKAPPVDIRQASARSATDGTIAPQTPDGEEPSPPVRGGVRPTVGYKGINRKK